VRRRSRHCAVNTANHRPPSRQQRDMKTPVSSASVSIEAADTSAHGNHSLSEDPDSNHRECRSVGRQPPAVGSPPGDPHRFSASRCSKPGWCWACLRWAGHTRPGARAARDRRGAAGSRSRQRDRARRRHRRAHRRSADRTVSPACPTAAPGKPTSHGSPATVRRRRSRSSTSISSKSSRHPRPSRRRPLKETAAAWRDQLRAGDVLARIGGEEFGLLLPNCDIQTATEVIDRLRRSVTQQRTCSARLTV
jgi:hypothetical protein